MPDQTLLKSKIWETANVKIRFGCLRVLALLQREGWLVNLKPVYRLYREMDLSLRMKRPRRHRTAKRRTKLEVPSRQQTLPPKV